MALELNAYYDGFVTIALYIRAYENDAIIISCVIGLIETTFLYTLYT